jgi:hypothetical protein
MGALCLALPAHSQILSRYRGFQFSDGEKLITDRSEKVIACWEDAQYSLNLFQFDTETTFGLAVYSKRLETLAQAAIVEGLRLDEQEALQKESESRKKKEDEDRARQEKPGALTSRLFAHSESPAIVERSGL